jgi:glutamine---fructose-6-phosphate transaminase (isomerizing)
MPMRTRVFRIIEGPYLKDLLDQRQALQKTLERLRRGNKLEALAHDLARGKFQRVVLTGMGSSYHVLHPLHQHLIRHHFGAVMVETSELVHHLKALLRPATLVVAVSQSGRSAEILRLLEMIGPGITLCAVTNDEQSPLARQAKATVLLRAGTEYTVTCKTYVASLAALEWLASILSGLNPKATRNELCQAPDAVQQYLARWRRHVEAWLSLLEGVRHVFVVGRGASLGAAGTAGLILKESAHFPAEGMSSAAFRHGPFEMLNGSIFVLALAGDARALELNRRLVADIIQAGGRVALVGGDAKLKVFRLPAVPASVQPIVEILPVQMLSLALAARQGREAGKFELTSKITTIE